MYFTSNDGSQNIFVYQLVLDKLELKKKDEGTDYILNWKSKGAYTSKLKPLLRAFSHSKKLSGYRMRIKFDKNPLAVEQNNYTTKIAIFYIVYDSDSWPKNLTDSLKFKNCLFGATNMIKNSDKEKDVYSGYGITFDSVGSRSFDNDTAINILTFGVHNSSKSHATSA